MGLLDWDLPSFYNPNKIIDSKERPYEAFTVTSDRGDAIIITSFGINYISRVEENKAVANGLWTVREAAVYKCIL